MKMKCPLSGVTYHSDDLLPGEVTHLHPMLSESISASYLTKTYLPMWAGDLLIPEQVHLLGIAYLLKLPLASIPSFPNVSHEVFEPFWDKHMERLAKLACKLEGKELIRLPRLRITPDTIDNLTHQLDDLWTETNILFSPMSEKAKKLNKLGYKNFLDSENEKVSTGLYDEDQINSIILRGMKGSPLSGKESKVFPDLVANWAARVGNFPLAYVTLESGKKVTVCQVWKDIIISAFSKDGIYKVLEDNVTLADCEELLEYCYSEIPVGTLHASQLFKKLETVKEVLEEFRVSATPKFEKPKFAGTETDLLSLLADDSEVKEPPKPVDSPMSLSQRLAVRMNKVKKSNIESEDL